MLVYLYVVFLYFNRVAPYIEYNIHIWLLKATFESDGRETIRLIRDWGYLLLWYKSVCCFYSSLFLKLCLAWLLVYRIFLFYTWFHYILLKTMFYRKQSLYLHKVGVRVHPHHPQTSLAGMLLLLLWYKNNTFDPSVIDKFSFWSLWYTKLYI